MDTTQAVLQPNGKKAVHAAFSEGSEADFPALSQACLSGLLEHSPVSILVADLQGTIEYVNPKFTKVTGYSSRDAVGQNTRLVNSGEQSQELYEDLWATLKAGRNWEGDLSNRTKTGALVWEHMKITPLRDSGDRIIAYLAIKEDISAQRRAELECRQLSAQLHQSQKLESLGSLAGGVAHDINNVLAAILSSVSIHREKLEGHEPLAKSMDTIARACMRGRDVVKSLLYFAHKDLETVGPVDLNAIARDIVMLMESATLKRIRVTTELTEPLGEIHGDAGALSHALMNLCVNAMDAMPQGGALTIRSRRSAQGGIELGIQDTGHGMSPEVMEKAMEPFFTTKPVGKGTGLGLSIVSGTMKAHGGTVVILSEPGKGTEVSLRFPCLAKATAPVEVRDPAPPEAPMEPEAPLGILVVDDDELIQASLPPMLESLGHRVHTAAGSLEMLERFQGGLEADLLILDLNMLHLGGPETLSRLLRLRPRQAVLLSTGYNDEELARLQAEYPQFMSIRKPFTLEEMRDKITAVMGQ